MRRPIYISVLLFWNGNAGCCWLPCPVPPPPVLWCVDERKLCVVLCCDHLAHCPHAVSDLGLAVKVGKGVTGLAGEREEEGHEDRQARVFDLRVRVRIRVKG
jgi:hypothetical protein